MRGRHRCAALCVALCVAQGGPSGRFSLFFQGRNPLAAAAYPVDEGGTTPPPTEKTTMTHTILSRLGLLLLTASIGLSVTACDPETTVEGSQARELDYDELDDLIEDVREEVEESEQDAVDHPTELSLTDDAAPVAFKSLEECLVQYCFVDEPWLPNDGQCITAQHPFGMAGVCILDTATPDCAVWEFYGEYCTQIAM